MIRLSSIKFELTITELSKVFFLLSWLDGDHLYIRRLSLTLSVLPLISCTFPSLFWPEYYTFSTVRIYRSFGLVFWWLWLKQKIIHTMHLNYRKMEFLMSPWTGQNMSASFVSRRSEKYTFLNEPFYPSFSDWTGYRKK